MMLPKARTGATWEPVIFTAQHENTIRYRLEKIATLTGLDFKIQPQMEELSLAIRIDTCIRLLQNEIV